jgi:hypothetical protein
MVAIVVVVWLSPQTFVVVVVVAVVVAAVDVVVRRLKWKFHDHVVLSMSSADEPQLLDGMDLDRRSESVVATVTAVTVIL